MASWQSVLFPAARGWRCEEGVAAIGPEFFLHERSEHLARHPGAPPPIGRRWGIEPLEGDSFRNFDFGCSHSRFACCSADGRFDGSSP